MTETKRRIKEYGFNSGWSNDENIYSPLSSAFWVVDPNYKDGYYFEKPPSVFTHSDTVTPKKVSARAALRLLIDRDCPPEIMKSYPPFNKTGRSSYSDADVWRILTRVLCYPSPYALKHLLHTFFKTLGFPKELTQVITEQCAKKFEQARAKEFKQLDHPVIYEEVVNNLKWVDIVDAWSRGYDYENEKSMNEYQAWKSMQQKEHDSQFEGEYSQESKEVGVTVDLLKAANELIESPEKAEETRRWLKNQLEYITNGYKNKYELSKEKEMKNEE